MKHKITVFILLVCSLVLVSCAVSTQPARATDPSTISATDASPVTTRRAETPASTISGTRPSVQLEPEVIVSGLAHPWDLAQLPDGSLLFTQRGGALSVWQDGQVHKIAEIPDVAAVGEGGLTGLALDSSFNENRLFYLAYNTVRRGEPEVVVTRYRLTENLMLEDAKTIVDGLPAIASGRHSGCQLEMGTDGSLWIATGDSATAAVPQDPQSLGGKILRVNRDGQPVPGNLPKPFDPRIFSYGHRNPQGLAILPEPVDGVYGYSAEHGPAKEDEFNPIKSGNFGWAPAPPYNERVPMTDTRRFPDAIEAIWNSGSSTIAVSGLSQIRGDEWGDLDGAYVMGVLKGSQIRVLLLEDGKLDTERIYFEKQFGRIRASVFGADNTLYLTTDNGRDDKIIRVRPIS